MVRVSSKVQKYQKKDLNEDRKTYTHPQQFKKKRKTKRPQKSQAHDEELIGEPVKKM